VRADDVYFTSWVTEECADPLTDAMERTFARPTEGIPVTHWHDEKQMLSIRSDVGLPHVLEVVVVCCGSATLDLCENSASFTESIEEVGTGASHQSILGSEHLFFAETKALAQESCHKGLNSAASCTVDVDCVDSVRFLGKKLAKLTRQAINHEEVSGLPFI